MPRFLLPVLLFLTACGASPGRPATTPAASPVSQALPPEPTASPPTPVPPAYLRALDVAKAPAPSRVVSTLVALTEETPGLQWREGRVLVYTWTEAKYYPPEEFEPGKRFNLKVDIWASTGTEVFDVCSKGGLEGEALDRRLEQLLGLPPDGDKDAFLAVWIDPDELIRPCADPRVVTASCPIGAPMKLTDAGNVSWDCDEAKDHAKWLCDLFAGSYDSPDPLKRYPFTALGYTFDWNPENPTGVGVSEFYAKQDSPAVFSALIPTEDFCQPAEGQPGVD